MTARPQEFQGRHAVKGRVQNTGNERAQVRALQILRQAVIDVLRFLRYRLPVRASGPKAILRRVQDAVFAREHGRGHLIVGGEFRQDAGVFGPLAQDGIGIRQLVKPQAHIRQGCPGVLARGDLAGQALKLEGQKIPVRQVNAFSVFGHKKAPPFRA